MSCIIVGEDDVLLTVDDILTWVELSCDGVVEVSGDVEVSGVVEVSGDVEVSGVVEVSGDVEVSDGTTEPNKTSLM